MTTLTRDDTEHDVEYVTKHEAQMEIDAVNADRLRLHTLLDEAFIALCCDGRATLAEAIRQALTTPPPPVVAKADADALADACKLCAAVIGPPDNIEWASIDNCDAAYAAAQTAMQAYHAKYPAP